MPVTRWKNQSGKATHCMIPTILSRKGKTVETVKICGCQGLGQAGMNRQSTEGFQVSDKTPVWCCNGGCTSLSVYHLDKFIHTECTTLKVNCNVNYGLRAIKVCYSIAANVPLCWGMLVLRRLCVRGAGVYGKSNFPLILLQTALKKK